MRAIRPAFDRVFLIHSFLSGAAALFLGSAQAQATAAGQTPIAWRAPDAGLALDAMLAGASGGQAPARAGFDPAAVQLAQAQPGAGASTAEGAKLQAPAAAPADWSLSLAVIYPDIPEPYRGVFLQIIEGIEEATQSKVRSYAVDASVDASELNIQLRRHGVKAVIALGRQGLKMASALDSDVALTVGGVISLPPSELRSLSGVSLTPDPALLFARLKSLQPAAKRVWVVYDAKHNDWLMRLAREAAKAQGLELLTQEVSDLSEAIKAHEQVFSSADPKRDAVWLPQDATAVDEQTVLPLVLRESWQRSVPVFSSNYIHVKKGVLFVLYPNNQELGRTLALAAQRGMSGEQRKGVLPLRDVYAALNLRTANHIGLSLTDRQQRSFNSVFP